MYLIRSGDHVQYRMFVPPSSNNSKPPPGVQFWILLVLSLGISGLYVLEIFLSHAIIKEQRFLVDQHEIADSGGYYKEGWQKLAVETWKASGKDPTMLEFLKSEGVGVHEGPPPGSESANSTGATNAAAVAPAAPVAPTPTPAQPATP